MRVYSKALFNLTHELEKVEEVVSVLKQFMPFFTSPHINQAVKGEVLKKSLQGEPVILSFLLFLIEKRRFNWLPAIFQDYSRRIREKQGILQGQLITKEPVTAEQKEKLKIKLEKLLKKKVVIEEEVDPALIGGGKLVFGDKLVDFSVRAKLARLKQELLK